MGKQKREYGHRVRMRVERGDIDRLEIYMYRLSNLISFRTRCDKKAVVSVDNGNGNTKELTLDQIKSFTTEVARLDLYINMYDSMVGGRGMVYFLKDITNGDEWRYGNIEVLCEVRGMVKNTVLNALRRGSVMGGRYTVSRFNYEDLITIEE